MIKVIETNISGTKLSLGNIQQRIIMADNWQDYVEEMTRAKQVDRLDMINRNLNGCSMPRCNIIESHIDNDNMTMIFKLEVGAKLMHKYCKGFKQLIE